ncbi:bifunctional adenosylcobinamide kinase/adenosylcobinamide-phosphate guanylyltransferase [Caldalkalibacillus salinus]|uniref:bifunctional adenosylcobinamide kinase/adenosylcobinamide-phosphate guanylyltransferase n=1 Tax=Caldalkalibacillus salinus TaxID=2803787 RepID=UPI001920A512
MLLVVGGAYAGKRKIVRSQMNHNRCEWISAYEGHRLERWRDVWVKTDTIVIEGWERWLKQALHKGQSIDELRERMQNHLQALAHVEQERRACHAHKDRRDVGDHVILIMLEMGRGVVPMDKSDRDLRDLCGWLLQDATQLSERVLYVWHGLYKQLKGNGT